MNTPPFQTITGNISQILRAIDEIGSQAQALGQCPLHDLQDQSPAAARHTLEHIAGNLDRIVARAQEIELLVALVPDADVARDLQAPSALLRDAVTSLVVYAYGAAGASTAAHPSPA